MNRSPDLDQKMILVDKYQKKRTHQIVIFEHTLNIKENEKETRT